MDPNTTSAIRDIFVIVGVGVFTALCLVIIVLILKLYRPLRDAAYNASTATGNLSSISGDLASVSEGNGAKHRPDLQECSERLGKPEAGKRGSAGGHAHGGRSGKEHLRRRQQNVSDSGKPQQLYVGGSLRKRVLRCRVATAPGENPVGRQSPKRRHRGVAGRLAVCSKKRLAFWRIPNVGPGRTPRIIQP